MLRIKTDLLEEIGIKRYAVWKLDDRRWIWITRQGLKNLQ